jgi:exonuclease III
MNWNIRGINSEKKWLALGNKIEECGCEIICLQDTKREHFDLQFIRKFCPKKFTKFLLVLSVGAYGGIIIIWNGNLFNDDLAFQNEFCLSINLTNKLTNEKVDFNKYLWSLSK